MTTLSDPFIAVEDHLNNYRIFERREEVHAALLALLAKKHLFMLGPPGIAKSYLVTELCKLITDMPDDGYFHYLLTRYTTPDELYGPPNLEDFKLGVFRRNTTKKMPKCLIAFLDEIFLGNSSILNANLTLLNERLFRNHDDDPHVPLISCFSAANVLPSGDELDALWDRIDFRFITEAMKESSSFMRMMELPLNRPFDDMPADYEAPTLSLGELYAGQLEVAKVEIPDEILTAIKQLRDDMKTQRIEATERRWVNTIEVIRAEAFLNGHDVAMISDMRPLQHILWNTPEQLKPVRRLVLDLASPIDKDAQDLLERVEGLALELREAIRPGAENDAKVITKIAVDIHTKLKRTKAAMEELEERQKEAQCDSKILPALRAKIVDVARDLKKDGFNFVEKK